MWGVRTLPLAVSHVKPVRKQACFQNSFKWRVALALEPILHGVADTNAASGLLWLGGSGVCPSLAAKGLCNRLTAVSELPATSGNSFAGLWGK